MFAPNPQYDSNFLSEADLENHINQTCDVKNECLSSLSQCTVRGSSSNSSTSTVRKRPFEDITNTLGIRQISQNQQNMPLRHNTPVTSPQAQAEWNRAVESYEGVFGSKRTRPDAEISSDNGELDVPHSLYHPPTELEPHFHRQNNQVLGTIVKMNHQILRKKPPKPDNNGWKKIESISSYYLVTLVQETNI